MKGWFNRLHIRSLEVTNTKWGFWLLFSFAFADAACLPLPVTTFFLVVILLNTKKTFNYLIFIILGTLTGALAGYAIGHFLWLGPNGEFTGLVQFLFKTIPGFSEGSYNNIHSLYAKWDFWILCGAAFTPIPYGIFSSLSGVFDTNILVFFFATLISQGIKFFVLAFVTLKIGPQANRLMQINWKPVAIIISAFIIIAIIVFRSI
jgi:membrane protein YqaA with SNARE-associated domain